MMYPYMTLNDNNWFIKGKNNSKFAHLILTQVIKERFIFR